MVVLSRCIMEITETDYDGVNTTYKRIRPKFDDVVCNGVNESFPTTISDTDAKTAVRAKLTGFGYTRDSEI